MTLSAMSHVWELADLTPAQKLVLLYLADAADDYGYCWPSIARIAKHACITDRYASEVIQSLTARGSLALLPSASELGTNYYRITGMPDPQPTSSGKISSQLRAWVFFRDGGLCAYCGERASELDHVIPRSRGGREVFDNIVAACRSCNASKKNKTPSDFNPPRFSPIWKAAPEQSSPPSPELFRSGPLNSVAATPLNDPSLKQPSPEKTEDRTTTSKPPEAVVVDFLPSPDWKTRTWGTNDKDFDLRFLTWVYSSAADEHITDYPSQTPVWDMTHEFVMHLKEFMPISQQVVGNIRAFVARVPFLADTDTGSEFVEGVCQIAKRHEARSWLYVQRIAERHLNEHRDPHKSVWRELNGEGPDRLDAYRQSYGRYMKATS